MDSISTIVFFDVSDPEAKDSRRCQEKTPPEDTNDPCNRNSLDSSNCGGHIPIPQVHEPRAPAGLSEPLRIWLRLPLAPQPDYHNKRGKLSLSTRPRDS